MRQIATNPWQFDPTWVQIPGTFTDLKTGNTEKTMIWVKR